MPRRRREHPSVLVIAIITHVLVHKHIQQQPPLGVPIKYKISSGNHPEKKVQYKKVRYRHASVHSCEALSPHFAHFLMYNLQQILRAFWRKFQASSSSG
ncbi:hypothetical protein BCR43DRAFT_485361 [Syncephalastrum racemosum]|uniref:Uncharacterized protein n=1 Tax=Syncephalastrum racemosum TaxID=13706 RepID=A0A1X2HNR3_SYNRA|nr:hypothetical protein BCR43DRAFT_485361 [Syncephalastrum racemosum]